ncbi:hypothetical protein EZS27_023758, partial [termite gut metagenome]
GEGVLNITPAGILTGTLQNGNYAEAWKKGKQAGHESWAASQSKAGEADINTLLPDLPSTPQPAGATNFDDLLGKLGKTKTGKGKKNTLKLDQVMPDLNESAEYTAVTRGLLPVRVALTPTGMPDKLQPGTHFADAVATAPGKVDDKAQNYDPEKENYLADIMENVCKIAASVMLPLALTVSATQAKNNLADIPLSAPDVTVNSPVVNVPNIPVNVPDMDIPTPSDAYRVPEREKITKESNYVSENSTTVEKGKTVYVDRVCDNIVIHVENTDGKGSDTIRAEIMNVLNEILEG